MEWIEMSYYRRLFHSTRFTVKPLSLRVLRLFREMGEDRLDLHVLFEAGGNEPEERLLVLDALDELVKAGMLDARSGDFYELTEKGKGAAAQP
jgi:hypothetical protein